MEKSTRLDELTSTSRNARFPIRRTALKPSVRTVSGLRQRLNRRIHVARKYMLDNPDSVEASVAVRVLVSLSIHLFGEKPTWHRRKH